MSDFDNEQLERVALREKSRIAIQDFKKAELRADLARVERSIEQANTNENVIERTEKLDRLHEEQSYLENELRQMNASELDTESVDQADPDVERFRRLVNNGYELLEPIHPQINYSFDVMDVDPWTIELSANKWWMDDNERLLFSEVTLIDYDHDHDDRDNEALHKIAMMDREELLDIHRTQGLQAAMQKAEKMAVEHGHLDSERQDSRLFQYGPVDSRLGSLGVTPDVVRNNPPIAVETTPTPQPVPQDLPGVAGTVHVFQALHDFVSFAAHQDYIRTPDQFFTEVVELQGIHTLDHKGYAIDWNYIPDGAPDKDQELTNDELAQWAQRYDVQHPHPLTVAEPDHLRLKNEPVIPTDFQVMVGVRPADWETNRQQYVDHVHYSFEVAMRDAAVDWDGNGDGVAAWLVPDLKAQPTLSFVKSWITQDETGTAVLNHKELPLLATEDQAILHEAADQLNRLAINDLEGAAQQAERLAVLSGRLKPIRSGLFIDPIKSWLDDLPDNQPVDPFKTLRDLEKETGQRPGQLSLDTKFAEGLGSQSLRQAIFDSYDRHIIMPWAYETPGSDIAEMMDIESAAADRFRVLGLGHLERDLAATRFDYALALHQQAGYEDPAQGLIYDEAGRHIYHAQYREQKPTVPSLETTNTQLVDAFAEVGLQLEQSQLLSSFQQVGNNRQDIPSPALDEIMPAPDARTKVLAAVEPTHSEHSRDLGFGNYFSGIVSSNSDPNIVRPEVSEALEAARLYPGLVDSNWQVSNESSDQYQSVYDETNKVHIMPGILQRHLPDTRAEAALFIFGEGQPQPSIFSMAPGSRAAAQEISQRVFNWFKLGGVDFGYEIANAIHEQAELMHAAQNKQPVFDLGPNEPDSSSNSSPDLFL